MEGRVLQLPGHKKTESHPVKTFIVHFRAPNTKPVKVTAKCFQPLNGVYIGFFNESSKEVGKALLSTRVLPDSIALFRSADVSHVVEEGVMKGKVPVNGLINREYVAAMMQDGEGPSFSLEPKPEDEEEEN